MAKVLVLYYSMYGHIETMARAVAEGASKVDGAEVVVKRVPETMPPQLFEKAGGKTQTAPVATPQELADYDGMGEGVTGGITTHVHFTGHTLCQVDHHNTAIAGFL